jgi:aspartyl-tRNA(Asn)/glutamyl-tRNA(Gln) amidotransferase subunit B
MEKGSLRCDANISLKGRAEKKLGSKVELKNMNSFKNVRDALEYEVSRQADILAGGGAVVQETRLWNADRRLTEPMRYKEEETDYRYFPEPDLVPFVTDARAIDEMRNSLPELPEARRSRLMTEYGLSGYDAAVLTSDLGTADYFEECLGIYKNAKTLANWITGDMAALANVKGTGIRELGLSARALAGLLRLVDEGAISGKMAKEVLSESIETGRDPGDIVASRGLAQISDAAELEAVVKAVISANAKSAADYRGGKKNALAFLIGQVMKATAGKANPAIVNEVLKKHLEG